jgi:hypothetical protein
LRKSGGLVAEKRRHFTAENAEYAEKNAEKR